MPSRLSVGLVKVIDLQNRNYRSAGGISLFCPVADNFWFRATFSPGSSVRTITAWEGSNFDLRGSIGSERREQHCSLLPFVQSISNRYRDREHHHPCRCHHRYRRRCRHRWYLYLLQWILLCHR
jgi:hypothetical protein